MDVLFTLPIFAVIGLIVGIVAGFRLMDYIEVHEKKLYKKLFVNEPSERPVVPRSAFTSFVFSLKSHSNKTVTLLKKIFQFGLLSAIFLVILFIILFKVIYF